MVFTEALSWGLQQFFPNGTYAGIGTTCVKFDNVMKSATIKKMLLALQQTAHRFKNTYVSNVHIKELNLLLVGKTSHLEVILRERDGSDSPNN